MRFLISMVFVGVLAFSNSAVVERLEGLEAENILLKGKQNASTKWFTPTYMSLNQNQHFHVFSHDCKKSENLAKISEIETAS